MRITLLQTGKTRDRFIIEGVEEFRKRVVRYAPFTIETVADLKNTRNMTTREIQAKEGEMILKRVKAGDYLVLLDERGKEFHSLGFAKHLNALEGRVNQVIFVIGGPYGFSEQVYRRANEKFSLSKLTFSHQLIRLLFMEQIYRAFTILKGEPYHHE